MGNGTSRDDDDSDYVTNWSICPGNEGPQEEEEPFDFGQLPADLQYKIVDRLNYKDYSVLDQTSRLGNAVCCEKAYSLNHHVVMIFVNKKTMKLSADYEFYDRKMPRVPWHVAARPPTQITADSISISSRLSSGRMQAVAKLFEENGTRCEMLGLAEHITFKPADLDRLIKSIKAKHLDSRQFVPREFFEVEAVKGLESMTLSSCGFTDDELLGLKCEYMYLENDFVTARGLNRFLKQWKKKEREINAISIEFDSSFSTRNFDIILDGLDANMIWAPEMHEHSLVGKVKLNDFPPMQTGDPEYLYCLFRPDDIENTRILRLSMGRFEVFCTQHEAGCLLSYLDDDQYYVIRGTCLYCDVEFCSHRRRLSMQRLKRFYPRLHSSMIYGYRAMMCSFGALRVEKVLMGERPFTRPPLFEYERSRHESGFSRLLSHLRVLLFDHV